MVWHISSNESILGPTHSAKYSRVWKLVPVPSFSYSFGREKILLFDWPHHTLKNEAFKDLVFITVCTRFGLQWVGPRRNMIVIAT
jgi:hypothetical protein